MKYYEVEMTITPCTQDAQDILSAMAAEAGFETFEETPTGLLGYVQQSLFLQDALDAVIANFPFEGTHIIYNVREAEDKDWNEQWEQEGFEPIEVSNRRSRFVPLGQRSKKEDGRCVIIHDGRHLPSDIGHQTSSPSRSMLISLSAQAPTRPLA